jgi:hypothetical protein
MAQTYNASDIEVLKGLEPVRRRPGMYTDTRSPNHLVHEVVDNSVDEALSGHCEHIAVTVHKDGSVSVDDDGRGMPVDIHPKEKVSGVELILTRLHAGGKFSDKNYESAGGLHGVGVSVVNALSKHLECNVRRDGKEWNIGFRDGRVVSKLEAVGTTKRGDTGTTLRFWPDPGYFDSANVSVPRLKHVLKAKAVLCPGLRVSLEVEASGEKDEWYFTGDLGAYLVEQLGNAERLPAEPYAGALLGAGGRVAGRRELRQPDPHAAGRNPRQRAARRLHRRGARVLRVQEPGAARPQARARGRLDRRRLRAVGAHAESAVRRADEGEALVARVGGVRLRRRQGRVRALAQPAS